MARQYSDTYGSILELTRKEATDIIGLLSAQLADEPLIGNHGGACPQIIIETEADGVKKRMSLIIRGD